MLKPDIVVLILITGNAAAKQSINTLTVEEFTDHLDRRIPALMDSYNVPGLAIALIHGGEPVWIKAYGYADLETGRSNVFHLQCFVKHLYIVDRTCCEL